MVRVQQLEDPRQADGVFLYRYAGNNQWVDTGRKTTSNSSGAYALSQASASGYYYAVYGYKVFNYCYWNINANRYDGNFLVYRGWSNYVLARAATTHRLPVDLAFAGYIPCS